MIIKSRKIKIFILVLLFFFMGISFVFHFFNNELEPEELTAPINVNVELDKEYSDTIVLIANPYDGIINFTPTGYFGNALNKTIVHTEITGYITGLAIRALVNENGSVSFIDSISIFTGNILFYFGSFDIAGWERTENNGYTDYAIPLGMYKKTLIKPWVNWYGDLNYILRIIMALITRPYKYFLVYFAGFIMLLFFYRNICSFISKYNDKIEIVLLSFLLVFGFLTRINTVTRHSAWVDELWSAVLFSNPNQSIAGILGDPGNPPLYYFLLRIWFSVFGWTETAGRLFSCIIGTIGIVTMYSFVRFFCGKKYAFMSAFLLAISYSSVGHSNQMRAYILLIMLGPLVSMKLLVFLEKADFRNSVAYLIPGILLVNTHYYGILYIIGNFIFYFIHKKYGFKQLIQCFLSRKYPNERKEITRFFLINVFIAMSFMPFFIMTVLPNAILDRNFNSWIPKPGKTEYLCTVILILLYIVVVISATVLNKKSYNKRKITLFHYSFFLVAFIYISAFTVSLYRPVLVNTYLSICLPLVAIILTFFVNIITKLLSKSGIFAKTVIPVFILIFAVLSNFISSLHYFGGGTSDVIKESIEYIAIDSKNYDSAAQIDAWWWNDDISNFYAFTPLSRYNDHDDHDVLYLPVFHTLTNELVNQELMKNGVFGANRILLGQNRYLIKSLPSGYINQ